MTVDRLSQAADALNQAVARRTEGGQAAAFQATLSAAVRGEERAFAALWRDLQPALLRYLRVVAPRGAADEISSQTWLDVVEGLSRFQGDEAAFRAWVFTIARHRALDRQRRTAPRQATLPPAEPVADRAVRPEPAALGASAEQATSALLASLPPAQAEALLLRVVAGLDVTQVARIVGKRPGAVRVLLHRGMRRLADQLESNGGQGDQEPKR
jgi:RNA polymerase sigma-70 factor, ECF subfamily